MSRFNSEQGDGARGGGPGVVPDMSTQQRGGTGAEPHSAAGFRRALMKTQRGSNRLKDQLPNKTSFGGQGFKKPNYFAQGGKRHGMHIGAGAPVVTPATDSGADFGGGE